MAKPRTRKGPSSPASAPVDPPADVNPDDLPDAPEGPAPAPQRGGLCVAFVADVHVGTPRWCGGVFAAGLNRRAEGIVDTLRRAVQAAHAGGAQALVVCGDLFDTSSPSPQLVAAVGRVLTEQPFVCGVHVLKGNHDTVSDTAGDHALAPLALMPGIEVHERAAWVPVASPGYREVAQVLMLPFQSGVAAERLRWDAQATAPMPDIPGPRIVAMHAGISDAATPLHLRGLSGAMSLPQAVALARTVGAVALFAGDWHDRRQWSVSGDGDGQPVEVMQVGALVPTDFRNPGADGFGTVAFWRSSGVGFDELPGHRFLIVRDRASFDAAVMRARGAAHRFFVRWVAAPHDFDDAVASMREETTLGVFVGGDVVPGGDAPRSAVRAAVANAQQPANLRAAVSTYVQSLPCEDAQRDRVQSFALMFLGLEGV